MLELRRVLWLGMLTGACVSGLPSLEPLGAGPLAEPEPTETARRPPASPRRPTEIAVPAASDDPPSDAGTAAATSAVAATSAMAAASAVAAPGTDAGAAVNPRDRTDTSSPILLGEYRGPDTTILRLDGFPDRRDDDPNARTRVESAGERALRIVILNSATGETICELAAQSQGQTAAILPGQSCFAEGDEMTALTQSGEAVFTRREMVLDLRLELEVDFGDETAAGEIEYHFEGALP